MYTNIGAFVNNTILFPQLMNTGTTTLVAGFTDTHYGTHTITTIITVISEPLAITHTGTASPYGEMAQLWGPHTITCSGGLPPLTISIVSSNQVVITTTKVNTVVDTSPTPGIAIAQRRVTYTPDAIGTAIIQSTCTDSNSDTQSESFTFQVTYFHYIFSSI
jgi:hypothetical protein